MLLKDSHCSYCGRPFAADAAWPRLCAGCDRFTYRNPLPVAVILVPVGDGVLAVRRGIEPRRGFLALPGGYVDFGESWQQGGAREVFEETGVRIDPDGIRDFRVRSSAEEPGILVIFGLARRLSERSLPPFEPSPEATERRVLTAPRRLAFTLHTEVLAEFFRRRRGRRPPDAGKPSEKA